MQKVLIITNVFPLEENKSRGCYILAQAKLLRRANFDVKIINPIPRTPPLYSHFNKKFIGFKKINNFRKVDDFDVFHPKYFRFPGVLFPTFNQNISKKILSKTYKWLDDWIPDIIHLHSIHPLLKVGNAISKKYKSKLFFTIHGWDFDVGINNKKIKEIIANNSSNVNGVCVVNENYVSIAKMFFPIEKINYIPCHFDIEEIHKRKINNFDILSKKIKILFPASPFRKEKNYTLFLKTVKELEKRGWDIEKKWFDNDSRRKAIKKFHWADLILITSKREGGPLVSKEAIYCGARVVSTSVGDVVEWLPSNSISAKNNHLELASCVENSLKNNIDIWKIPKKFEKEYVLEKLINLYEIN
ncbi:MAG: hypothetical protein CMB48_03370 [Euryarchaeota archaeon]|nr:hypothetical protein [Euryarchaeota archaeon]|tara:strand:+ start:8386 stop:9459 length:1074 start_codon:yes stop_codon:yes gene_type:complete